MTRAERRDVYLAFFEEYDSKQYAPAMPTGEERVDTSKGMTSHGAWFDAAIDFFDCAGDDLPLLHEYYLSPGADCRSSKYKQERREFWVKVKKKRLHLVAFRMINVKAA